MSWIAVGVIGAAAVGGAIANTSGKSKTTTSGSTNKSGLTLDEASQLEKNAGDDISSQYGALKQMYSSGPGQEAVDSANRGQNDFIRMLQQVNANGGMPTAEDTQRANTYADQLFAPQQEAMNQQYQKSQQDAAKLAAKLNRPINDPVIQARLQQEQMRQSAMLSADRTAYVAQEARNSPFQRLQLQGQLADAQGSLASQAMSNRMQLLNLGNSLQSQERNWRLQTAERYGLTSSDQQQQQEGGFAGGFNGAIAGAGAGASIMGSFGGLMGGGGSKAAPQAMQSGGASSWGGGQQSIGGGGDLYGAFGPSAMSPVRASRIQPSSYSGMGSLNYQSSYPWGTGIR